ncbi:MAG TPA: UbiA family prenyltransferase [Pseudonocardiaceae bacterium]|jgi:4-hydroxybenzoate polyprenyltransferase/geranylgeranylglycerol-phosphate geranylgeranyltransferase|nr:UbiA family prenyltransferase [Pseudonocardiaceae bacterium]
MHRIHSIQVTLLAHVEACRPDTVFYAGTVGLSGAILTEPHADPKLLFLAWLVPTLAWIASLYGGDYFDRDLDALTKPHRPIPSGRIQPLTARNLMIVLIGSGAVLAVLVNPFTVLLALPATVFGVAYARWLKGRGLWGNVSRGLPTALALLYGSMTVHTLPAPALVPLALMFWVHDSGSNLLGALCDRDGDRRGGYLTYPVRAGDEATVRGLVWFYVGWVVLALGGPLVPGSRVDPLGYYPPLAVVIALGWVALRPVIRAPRPIPRAVGLRAHEIVVAERIVLGTFLIAAAGRVELALLVGVPSLLLTVLARRLMRARYEPRR